MRVDRDLVYSSGSDYELLLDVYRPPGAASGPHPAVIVLYGGAWAIGSKDAVTRIPAVLARAGYVAIVPNYREAPPGGHWHAPAPVEDVRAALEWTRQNAASYEIDATRIGALGWSAGGNLAMMLGVGDDPVQAVVSWSGPSDLPRLMTTATPTQQELIQGYVGCSLKECPRLWRDVSPLYQVGVGDAPMYLANSQAEIVPVDQATRLASALRSEHVQAIVDVEPGARHGAALGLTEMQPSLEFFDQELASAST